MTFEWDEEKKGITFKLTMESFFHMQPGSV